MHACAWAYTVGARWQQRARWQLRMQRRGRHSGGDHGHVIGHSGGSARWSGQRQQAPESWAGGAGNLSGRRCYITGCSWYCNVYYRSDGAVTRGFFTYCVIMHTRPGSNSHEVMVEIKSEDQVLRVGTLKDMKQEFSVLVKLCRDGNNLGYVNIGKLVWRLLQERNKGEA